MVRSTKDAFEVALPVVGPNSICASCLRLKNQIGPTKNGLTLTSDPVETIFCGRSQQKLVVRLQLNEFVEDIRPGQRLNLA